MKPSAKLLMVFTCCLLLATFLASAPLSIADDHKEGKKHFLKHDGKKGARSFGEIFGRGRDKGNETTG